MVAFLPPAFFRLDFLTAFSLATTGAFLAVSVCLASAYFFSCSTFAFDSSASFCFLASFSSCSCFFFSRNLST